MNTHSARTAPHARQRSGPTELTDDEIALVGGGDLGLGLAVAGFGIALVGKMTASSAATWAVSSAGLLIGTVSLAIALDDKQVCDASTPLPGSKNDTWSDPFDGVGHIIDPPFGESL